MKCCEHESKRIFIASQIHKETRKENNSGKNVGSYQVVGIVVGGLVGPGKLISKWQRAEQRGNRLYTAEPQRFSSWHQVAVEMGAEGQVMGGLKIDCLKVH